MCKYVGLKAKNITKMHEEQKEKQRQRERERLSTDSQKVGTVGF
jgi:hypothetical protein